MRRLADIWPCSPPPQRTAPSEFAQSARERMAHCRSVCDSRAPPCPLASDILAGLFVEERQGPRGQALRVHNMGVETIDLGRVEVFPDHLPGPGDLEDTAPL